MSMRHDDLYLVDIIESAEKLAKMIQGVDTEGFKTDVKLTAATQYLLIVAGEACGKLQPSTVEAMPDVPMHQVRGFRNRLVHGYFDVDLDLVWEVAHDHIPPLQAAAELALERVFPDTFLRLQERRADGEA